MRFCALIAQAGYLPFEDGVKKQMLSEPQASLFALAIENMTGRRAIQRLTFLLLFVSRQKVKLARIEMKILFGEE